MGIHWRVFYLALTVITFSAGADSPQLHDGAFAKETQRSSSPIAAPLKRREPIGGRRFTRLAPETTAIDFVNRIDMDRLFAGDYRPALNGSLGGAVCVGDFDGDNETDLFFVARTGPNKLYRQTTPLRFEDVTARTGLTNPPGINVGASFVDIDNDDDLDLYVCRYASPNLLFINDGRGRFREAASDWGLDYSGSSVSAAFNDYDRDGDLDLYLVTNRLFVDQKRLTDIRRHWRDRLRIKNGKPIVPDSLKELMYLYEYQDDSGTTVSIALKAGQRDILFANQGDGTFVDVTAQAGLTAYYRGHSAIWWDYDGDGWSDLYVSNDYFDPDELFRNNGDGTFTNVTVEALPHTPWSSMGVDVGDVDNDGRFDLLATDMSATTHFKRMINTGLSFGTEWFLKAAVPRQYMRNALYLNSGTGRFLEGAYLAGLDSTDWTWAVQFGDLDNDGRIDVFFSNGFLRNIMDSDLKQRIQTTVNDLSAFGAALRKRPPLKEQNLAYRNLGRLKFEDVSQEWGLDFSGISTGAVLADLDKDGDLDVVINNINDSAAIYRNNTAGDHSILVRLQGSKSNRHGVGAVVRIQTDGGRTQVRQLTLNRGYVSSADRQLHFGLGDSTSVARLSIQWPSGRLQRAASLPADRLYEFHEPADSPKRVSRGPSTDKPMFREAASRYGLRFAQRAPDFDDFEKQPLLPYRPSQLGSGLAFGDADGDGQDDLFIGAGAGQAGRLYLNRAGRFFLRSGPWADDSICHDTTPLWLDIDRDGDLDLFVASGGFHRPPGDLAYKDRVYINDGTGSFTKNNAALPDRRTSTGPVAAADYDRDGDLDLFVGSRVVPWKYPFSGESALLRNDGGRFVDATDSVCPDLRQLGMVTGALWTDIDLDGYIDLLLTTEWGPIRCFANIRGKLVEVTQRVRLSNHLGWWNGIAGGDLDGDGDIDYWASNYGLNSRYDASPSHPALLYAGDFGAMGRPSIVEARYDGDTLYPVRGRRDSANAMPFVAAKFPDFRSFAQATLIDIYSSKRLTNSFQLRANTLASVLLMNRGPRGFEVRAAPRLAQISACFGAAITDLNADGRSDICVVQNFFGPQPKTGRIDGGIGVIMDGYGSRKLRVLDASQSGFVVPGDAKGLGVGDVNDDGWPDVVVTQNGAPILLFENQSVRGNFPLAIRLKGPPGNPNGVGARVLFQDSNGNRQTSEIYAGSGYLSQSSGMLFFGRSSPTPGRLMVRWPDGTIKTSSIPAGARKVVMRHPDISSRH